jgi:AraC-like DNA-binding protein
MKPQLLKVSKDLIHSFSARRHCQPDINNRWHYHSEIELIFFKKGHGTQYIGDRISPFAEGDVILVGSNLPHYWQFDEAYFKAERDADVDVSVVHFDQDFWGTKFLDLPENKEIKVTLEHAKRGIKLTGNTRQEIGEKIQKLVNAEGGRKLMMLMEVLLDIGDLDEKSLIASVGFHHNFLDSEKDRINAIYNYALNNYKRQITLEEISAVANISPTSFCKYFKAKSRKTFSSFINEIRISNACKLLMENELHVKEICYESGYYNFTSFHKYFKQFTGKSPMQYHKSFKR